MIWYNKCREIISALLMTIGFILYGSLLIIFTDNGIISYNANGVWYASALIAIGILGFLFGLFLLFAKGKNVAPMHPFKSKKIPKSNNVYDKQKIILSICGICSLILIGLITGFILGGKFELEGPSINDIVFGLSGVAYIIISLSVVCVYDYICYKVYLKKKSNPSL